MSWERRKRGGPYNYRARIVGGRVVKYDVADGPLAELVAAQDAQERAERRAAAKLRRAERNQLTNMDEAVQAPHDAMESLFRAQLILARAGGLRQLRRASPRSHLEGRLCPGLLLPREAGRHLRRALGVPGQDRRAGGGLPGDVPTPGGGGRGAGEALRPAVGERDEAKRDRRDLRARLERIKEHYKWGDLTRDGSGRARRA